MSGSRVLKKKSRAAAVIGIALAACPAQAQPDLFGGASLSGIYSSSSGRILDEEIDASALVARGYVGARLGQQKATRIQFGTNYHLYVGDGPRNRWSNVAEIEQRFTVSKTASVAFEGSGATNVSTLEARSADQVSARARLTVALNKQDRFTLTAAARRRAYDGSSAEAWAPMIEGDYRRRLGRYQYIDLESRFERVDSNDDLLDYRRLSLAGYYTHPLGRATRLRAGIAHRRWSWDERLTSDARPLRDQLWVPQARLTHALSSDLDLELDYRRPLRRSNDDLFDREGHRLAATIRTNF
ncbi:MAG: hypothetical protein V4696_09855 [Pseudomonadota bacterium]